MPIERELTGWELVSPSDLAVGQKINQIRLCTTPTSPYPGFTFELCLPLANAYRVLLTGPDRPRPPHNNVILPMCLLNFVVLSVDLGKHKAVLALPPVGHDTMNTETPHVRLWELHINWADSIFIAVHGSHGAGPGLVPYRNPLLADIPARSYALSEHGIIHHTTFDIDALHLGLGEKCAPLDHTLKRLQFGSTDAAAYDTYSSDPLYKHTPFLIVMPKPTPGPPMTDASATLMDNESTLSNDGSTSLLAPPVSVPATYAIYHPSNSDMIWDLGRRGDEPWGRMKTFQQDWGGLEEWVILGHGVQDVVRAFAEIVGKPKLVGRDWLGYLASGMGLGESDDPPAQALLEGWPDLCKKHDIPCSAMHLSSGYTVNPADGNRYVFTMNNERYPDFGGMVRRFHQAGIKVVPNIKAYLLAGHPDYASLYKAGALFHDPKTGKPVQTRVWSSGLMDNGAGGWVDMTSQAGRDWWERGVNSLIKLGCDGMWNDNNEYSLHDDEYLCAAELPDGFIQPPSKQGAQTVGLMGRMLNTELVAKVSHDALLAHRPTLRPFVLTRSANVGAMKYAASSWSGDNATAWHNLRGSQHLQLNAGLSLLQSYGSDVGGFAGELPTPEMFVRWVQLGVTHSRFCIHSFKPNTKDRNGTARTNSPWMYPEVLPIVRAHIKWRYELLPFFNNLNWLSHLEAKPPNAPLFFGQFRDDAYLYTKEMLDGFDAWLGVGKILVAPALFEGMQSRRVYFPKATPDDQSTYWRLTPPFATYTAGETSLVDMPLAHTGLFAREGAVIPIGKPQATVTQVEGPGRLCGNGDEVYLEPEGQVGLDDWRGVLIFPCPDTDGSPKRYEGRWIEDDGVSLEPATTVVNVIYEVKDGGVVVDATFEKKDFDVLWGEKLRVVLPVGDDRIVLGAERDEWKGRTCWTVQVRSV